MMDPKTKDSDLDRLFSINELADEFGIDKDAILFYEKKELIFPGKRRVLGLSYNEFDKFRLKFIMHAKNANYALGDIERLIGKIDPVQPEIPQIVKLAGYSAKIYQDLKQSLAGMDMLEQINVTCDLELLGRYLKDIHTLKSRSKVSDFNRLRLVKSIAEPAPPTTRTQRVQQNARSKPMEPNAAPHRPKTRPLGLYAAVAALLLSAGILLFFFRDSHLFSFSKTVVQKESAAIDPSLQENSPPVATVPATTAVQKQAETDIGSDSADGGNTPTTGTIPGTELEDSVGDVMPESLMEQNKELFARIYRNMDTGNTATAKVETPVTTDPPIKIISPAPEQTIEPAPIEPSGSTRGASGTAKSEETPADLAMTAFMQKISKKSAAPAPVTKEAPKPPDVAKPSLQKKDRVKNTTGTHDSAKPVPEKAPSVETTFTPNFANPVVLPAILSPNGTQEAESTEDTDRPELPPKKPSGAPEKPQSPLTASQPSEPLVGKPDKTTTPETKPVPQKTISPKALAWIQKSFDHVVNGNADEAIVAASVAISLDPDVASPYINRAWAYSKKGEHDKAIQDCNKALGIDPDSALALNNRGLAYQGKGDLERAKTDYDKACQLGLEVACRNSREIAGGMSVASLLIQIRDSYSREDWDGVIKFSTEVLKLSPDDISAYNDRSAAYSQKGFYYKAIKDCNDALKIDPKNALSFNNRGFALEMLGNRKAAILDYRKSCDLDLELGCQNYNRLK